MTKKEKQVQKALGTYELWGFWLPCGQMREFKYIINHLQLLEIIPTIYIKHEIILDTWFVLSSQQYRKTDGYLHVDSPISGYPLSRIEEDLPWWFGRGYKEISIDKFIERINNVFEKSD